MIDRLKHTGVVALFLMIYGCLPMNAQQFSVSSFRLLFNDISAYINPVKDLNQEACALIKVVGSSDFVFSTPLGIVQRKEEVGEVWIYVPHGTVQITVKHPQWGVLRDYALGTSLESRMTYELVLTPPVMKQDYTVSSLRIKPARLQVKRDLSSASMNSLEAPPMRWDMPWQYLVLANMGWSKSTPLWGMRIGMVKRHGFYASFHSSSYSMPDTHGSCDKDGTVLSVGQIPYYSGKVQMGNWKMLVGGLHCLRRHLYVYEGLGYGEKVVAWETSEEEWLYNEDYSAKGICVETGILYTLRNWAFSVGLLTIKGQSWEPTLGIGMCF